MRLEKHGVKVVRSSTKERNSNKGMFEMAEADYKILVKITDKFGNVYCRVGEIPDLLNIDTTKASDKKFTQKFADFKADKYKVDMMVSGTNCNMYVCRVRANPSSTEAAFRALGEILAKDMHDYPRMYQRSFVETKWQFLYNLLNSSYAKDTTVWKAVHKKLGVDMTYKAMRDFLTKA